MRTVEFSRPPKLDAQEERVTDLHSLMNILNIISFHLEELVMDFPRFEAPFSASQEQIFELARAFQEENDLLPLIDQLRQTEQEIIGQLRLIEERFSSGDDRERVRAAIENALSIYGILNVRLDELEFRLEDPDVCVTIRKDDLMAQIQDVLNAIEKNANGRYYIRYNLALKETRDYYIDLRVDSAREDGFLVMPLRFKDVVRDLLANARKYTEPGGKVALAMHQGSDFIECVIEDNGCGIPEDELEQVCEFGYRASNVRDRRTMGGGYGLTKAVWLILRWGGRIHVSSGVNEGTVVRIRVPVVVNQLSPELPAEQGV